MNLRRGTSQAILAFAGLCAHEGIDCCLLYIALLGLQCVASFEQYFIDRFYGRVIFIPAFTQELFFAKPSLLGGFLVVFTNLTLVNYIYFSFYEI